MATCQSCRKQVPDGTAHCPHCGAAQPTSAQTRTVFGYAPAAQDLQRLRQLRQDSGAPNIAEEPASPAAPSTVVDPMAATQFVAPDQPAAPPAAPAPGGAAPATAPFSGAPVPGPLFGGGPAGARSPAGEARAPTPAPDAAFPFGARSAPDAAPPRGGSAPGTIQPAAPVATNALPCATAAPLAGPAIAPAPAPATAMAQAVSPTSSDAMSSASRVSAGLFLGVVLGGALLSGGLTALGVANMRHMHELLFLSWLPLVPSVIFFCLLVYRAWAAIQDGRTAVSPGQAVGFLFIPLFNFYWMFVAIGSWPKEYAAFAERNQLSLPRIEPPVFLAYAITTCCMVIPVVNLLAALALLVLMVLVVLKLCEGINAIAGQR